jgi:hypothetical protein
MSGRDDGEVLGTYRNTTSNPPPGACTASAALWPPGRCSVAWARLPGRLAALNEQANDDEAYKLFFLARDGQEYRTSNDSIKESDLPSTNFRTTSASRSMAVACVLRVSLCDYYWA